MFETFRVAGLFVANSSVLATYAAGKPTGLVVDSGQGSRIWFRSLTGLPCRDRLCR